MDIDNDDSDSFVFPLNKEVVLINDFIVRREILERLPLPLGLVIKGEWVWANPSMRKTAHWKEVMASHTTASMSADSAYHIADYPYEKRSPDRSLLGVNMHPIFNVDGDPVGHLGWLSHPWLDYLETAVLVARERKIIWLNRRAKEVFGVDVQSSWNDVYGFPSWENVLSGRVSHQYKNFQMHCVVVEGDVLAEAWTPTVDPQGNHEGIPVDQVAWLMHEIRNPLAALSGYVEMAQLESSPEASHYYSEIMQEINRLSRLTLELLTVPNPRILQREWVLLDALVQHAWFAAERGRISGIKAVQLRKHYDSEQVIWGDLDRLQQVMINLIKNAVEAMQEKGSLITVSYREMQHDAIVTVADDGPGLSADVIRQLFDSRVTTKEGGHGLGLMIVRRIVEAHGGTIRVASENGTCVDIVLPHGD